jgi:sugar transferase (PEP-CTERM system associated)
VIRFFHAYLPTRIFTLGISEALLIGTSFVLAAIVRLGPNEASVMLREQQGFLKIVLLTVAFTVCLHYFDLYDSVVLSDRREVQGRLIQALGSMCIGLAVVYYFYPHLELGRGIVLIGFVIVATILLLWRGLFSALNGQPHFAARTLIFGEGSSASDLLEVVSKRPELGLNVIGQVSVSGNRNYTLSCDPSSSAGSFYAKLTDESLPEAIHQQRVNRIIVALEDRRGRLPVEALLSMKSQGIKIQDGTEFYEQVTGKIPIESLRLGTLLFSSGFRSSRFLAFYKRFASIVVSIIGLLLSLPLIPFVAFAIKLTSPGRLLYHQRRVGRNDTIFYCHKFRTMRADAEADTGPAWASDEDPRITRVGHFLRTTRLDEVPQLWNVLKGDMSLVGPRPERPEFIESLKQQIPYYNLRHTVRPGITGWAQIRYKYGSSVEDAREKLRYDLFYIKHMSPGLDALVFIDTVKTILLGRGAR